MKQSILGFVAVLSCFPVACPVMYAQDTSPATAIRDFSVQIVKGHIELKVKATINKQETDSIPAVDAQNLIDLWKDSNLTIQSIIASPNSARVSVQASPQVPSKDAPKVVSSFKPDLANLKMQIPNFILNRLYDMDVSLDPGQLSTLAHDCVSLTIYRADGSSTVLTGQEIVDRDASKAAKHTVCKLADTNSPTWRLRYDDAPIALVEIDGRPNHEAKEVNCAYASLSKEVVLFSETCQAQYILARNEAKKDDLILGMELKGNMNSPILSIEDSLLEDSASAYTVNGDNKIFERAEKSITAPDATWTVEWQKKSDGCRAVSANAGAYASLVLKAHVPMRTLVTNGIVVGAAKVYDVASLQRMLNTTASQLAAISGFNAGSINAAFGNLQGITRNTSYVNAQLTTAPTASISQQATLGVNAPNTTQTTTPIGSTTVTLQCPDGSLPTIGTSTTLGGCAPIPVTGTPNAPAYAPVTNSGGAFQGALTTTPAGSTTTNTGSTTTSQNQTTTTIPSVSGAAPSALTANTLSPPTNVGVSSTDILAEQVQLNSQITTLRLLLQGALSDQYLLKNARAVGERQQTTLGFTVALDPPRQFKHAVAEIRIIIVPTGRSDGPSIMNLLPSEKTYNVAKVTSSQKAFGAGAVIEPVSFGLSTGKSKDRLYLAKDTDTLALQYPLPVVTGHRESIGRPLPQKVHDIVKSVLGFQRLGGCAWDTAYSNVNGSLQQEMEREVTEAMVRGSQPTAFGWQFRPVLGADYVQGGERQVFAQLALGAGLSQNYVPDVYIETVWRDYDPKNQVVGAVYEGSCSLAEQFGGVNVLSQPTVRDVSVSDLGGGQLRLRATGNFYTSSLAVQSGQNILSSVFFDGTMLEVFGNAHDLMEGSDLKIVSQNGQNAPFGIATGPRGIQDWACGISNAIVRAAPRPDGNSRVSLDLTLGSRYSIAADKDGEPNPLVMINGLVYGLRESPFVNDSGGRCTRGNPATCHYEFLAPTTNLRNGQTFLVRDLGWDQMRFAGTTQFLPSFTAATALGTPESTAPVKTTYEISGYDFTKIASSCSPTTIGNNTCPALNPDHVHLRIYVDSDSTTVPFKVVSDNLMTVGEVRAGAKSLRFQIYQSAKDAADPDPTATTEWDLVLPKPTDDSKTSIVGSPAFLYVGDSQTISFSNATFSTFANSTAPILVFFDGNQVAGAKYDTKKKTLNVPITTTITKIPGHKELTVTVPAPQGSGTPQPTTLSFDVVRQVIKE